MKKKLTKEQMEKRNKIKGLLLRTLHIISYFLSVLFIITCIVAGFNSCSKNNKHSDLNVNLDLQNTALFDGGSSSQFLYESLYSSGEQTIQINKQWSVAHNLWNINIYDNAGATAEDKYYERSLNDVYLVKPSDNNFLELSKVTMEYVVYNQNNDSTWSYRLSYITFIGTNGNSYNFTGKVNSNRDNLTYNFSTIRLFSSVEIQSDIVFDNFFSVQGGKSLQFVFNQQINYNAPYNANLSSAYITQSNNGGLIRQSYNYGWFISGGQLFNQIDFVYSGGSGTFMIDGEEQFINDTNTILTYYYALYKNTITNQSVVVNQRSTHQYNTSNSGVSTCFDNSSYWVSNNYRYLTFLNGLEDSYLTELSKFNSTTTNVVTGNNTTDIGLGNVFDLLSLSFSGIISLFTIQIIPGLTIGILIFLPLVVTIIIVVFKVVKK